MISLSRISCNILCHFIMLLLLCELNHFKIADQGSSNICPDCPERNAPGHFCGFKMILSIFPHLHSVISRHNWNTSAASWQWPVLCDLCVVRHSTFRPPLSQPWGGLHPQLQEGGVQTWKNWGGKTFSPTSKNRFSVCQDIFARILKKWWVKGSWIWNGNDKPLLWILQE